METTSCARSEDEPDATSLPGAALPVTAGADPLHSASPGLQGLWWAPPWLPSPCRALALPRPPPGSATVPVLPSPWGAPPSVFPQGSPGATTLKPFSHFAPVLPGSLPLDPGGSAGIAHARWGRPRALGATDGSSQQSAGSPGSRTQVWSPSVTGAASGWAAVSVSVSHVSLCHWTESGWSSRTQVCARLCWPWGLQFSLSSPSLSLPVSD